MIKVPLTHKTVFHILSRHSHDAAENKRIYDSLSCLADMELSHMQNNPYELYRNGKLFARIGRGDYVVIFHDKLYRAKRGLPYVINNRSEHYAGSNKVAVRKSGFFLEI